jgi:predicted transcriptional regulator
MVSREATDISARRQAAGLTIYKLAKLAGVKWETLRNVERGWPPPRKRTLDRLERALTRVAESL